MKKLTTTLLMVISLNAFCQLEKIKSNIKDYLMKNLNDETSYKSIGWSKLDTLYSTIEEDGEYKHYKTYIDEAEEQNKKVYEAMNIIVKGINRDSTNLKNLIADSLKHYQKVMATGNYYEDNYTKYYKDQIDMLKVKIKEKDNEGNAYMKVYNNNLSNLEIAYKEINKRTESFNPEVIAYYICHQYRAKNAVGALINITRCFTLDNKYHILQVD